MFCDVDVAARLEGIIKSCRERPALVNEFLDFAKEETNDLSLRVLASSLAAFGAEPESQLEGEAVSTWSGIIRHAVDSDFDNERESFDCYKLFQLSSPRWDDVRQGLLNRCPKRPILSSEETALEKEMCKIFPQVLTAYGVKEPYEAISGAELAMGRNELISDADLVQVIIAHAERAFSEECVKGEEGVIEKQREQILFILMMASRCAGANKNDGEQLVAIWDRCIRKWYNETDPYTREHIIIRKANEAITSNAIEPTECGNKLKAAAEKFLHEISRPVAGPKGPKGPEDGPAKGP